MNLADALQKLSYGPLSELSIAGTGSGSVPVENVPKLVHHIGNALVALYTRFPLQLRTLELETVDGLFEYPLRTAFAQTSSSTELNKFIKDSAFDAFTGDVLKVVGITDVLTGDELPLNRRHDDLSWFITSYDTVRMGYPKTGDRYRIEYRARHAPLPVNPTAPEEIELRLPIELEAAFLAHIAGGVYGSMSMEGALAKAQGFMATFEGECSQHENANTWDQHNEPENTRFEQGGWV